jgi:hypothetical protein
MFKLPFYDWDLQYTQPEKEENKKQKTVPNNFGERDFSSDT